MPGLKPPGCARFSHMRPLLAIGVAVFLVCLRMPTGAPFASEKTDYRDCMRCHEGIESISERHPFPCADCHLLPGERKRDVLRDHGKIVRNPSAPAHMEAFCAPCHRDEVETVKKSLHATMAGIINQTRYLWGAQDRAAPALYGLSGPLRPLPEPPRSGVHPETPAMLVDDFLRRRCLRCHLQDEGPKGPGLYRATGCAACHVLYDDDGLYKGGDAAIDRFRPGYPVRHAFATRIPNHQCLHCHNHNHVGADYEGLFEHDYSDTYRSPRVDGRLQPMRYGLDHHRLTRDVHAERGLWCMDCHTRAEIMGDGQTYSFQMAVPKRSCADCHGGFGRQGPTLTNPAIRTDRTGPVLISKDQGKKHPIPQFRPDSTGHRVQAHARVRCSACHAQWSFQDYGMSVMREDRIDDYKWRDLSAQGDPALQRKVRGYAEAPDTAYPVSVDYLSGEEKDGIWSVGWRFRRWEPMPLGRDPAGDYAILRPLYQYLITYVDRAGRVVLDSVIPQRGDGTGKGWAFMPYVPHTIAPFGRACTSCHMNPTASGLGIQDEPTLDTALTIPSPPSIPGMRLLSPEEQKRLMHPTPAWHRQRLKDFEGIGD
jgi:hypothetical protein